ncbi:MAG: hypothetical protein KF893_02180 [Caldilineaceae bacterium]|nr:hypothetical protein [Caldilineaceae bacterium]
MPPSSTPLPWPIAYYVDGYHGGIAGHMPLGSMRDILREMERKPGWKISLEIEPFSWEPLRRRDPDAYRRLQQALQDQSVRGQLEVVSGSYAQPYCWAIGGESNIRQLLYGLALNRQHFPGVVIDTYAVQEPCWTSALPQILKSLGYVRASLKNPSTAWGGYTVGRDADVLNWIGPDGSSIPAVPRYACEDLAECWRTESIAPTAEFVEKCLVHGITNPTGMAYQDAGWPAHPAIDAKGQYVRPYAEKIQEVVWATDPTAASHIRHVTWREYFETIAPKASMDWHFSQEDIRVGLPWGAAVLQRLARQVRAAENQILIAEKMAAMATMMGVGEWPKRELAEAWHNLMFAQHHDIWIVSMSREERENWAWLAGAKSWIAECNAQEIMAVSAQRLSVGDSQWDPGPSRQIWARIFNTVGAERIDLVEIPLSLDPGTQDLRVQDLAGRVVPSQFVVERLYADGSWNAGRLLFPAYAPSLGYSTYEISPIYARQEIKMTGASVRADQRGVLHLETDLYHIQLNPAQGGVIISLYAKLLNKEFVDTGHERYFNEIRGYFPNLEQWLSNATAPADVEVLESGPLRLRVLMKGRIGEHGFQSTLTVVQGQPRIDCHVRILFDQEVLIGEAWDGRDTGRIRRRPCYDDRWKLQVFFPTPLQEQILYKNAAFDVCRSQNENTFFNSWDQLKHNVILNWVDLVDGSSSHGLALFSDHTTSYAHGRDYPLALILGWSGQGLWNKYYPIRGVQEVNYALIPHVGSWEGANLWMENSRWNEPLLAQIVDGQPPSGTDEYSLLSVSPKEIEISTAMMEGEDLLVRLFNGSASATTSIVSFVLTAQKVASVELDGRLIEEVPVKKDGDRCAVALDFAPFGLKTLRITR